MKKKKPVPEGNMSLRHDVPVSLKINFETACRLEGKTMKEVLISLMENYLNYSI